MPSQPGTPSEAEMRRRVGRAIARARRTVDETHVLRAASAYAREASGVARRCAWCRRYELAGRWISEDDLPSFLAAGETSLAGLDVSHTICESCFERENRRADERRRPRPG
jgi:hypothetical protein